MVTNQWKIQNRQICNNILMNCVNLQYKLTKDHLRFIQMLWSLNIETGCDRFYEEPYDTIKRILPKIKECISKVNTIEEKILKHNIIRNLKKININV